MANALYTLAKKAFLDGEIDLLTDTIKIALIDTDDYTVNLATDEFLDDIDAGARVATATLSSKSTTGGVFDAADPVFSAVTGDVSEALVIYQDTGVEGTSRLIGYYDVATGLPITPNGGDVTVTLDNGANKIFAL
jgi:hypothetical protein